MILNDEDMLRKYKFIVNTSKQSVTLISKDYVYDAANKAFSEAQNKTTDEIVGRTVAEIWGDDNFNEEIKQQLDKCLKGESVDQYTTMVNFPALGQRYFDINCSPYRDESGNITHVVVVSNDITERKLAEEALNESEARYHDLFEDAPISLWEEDYSDIKTHIDGLRASEITDFREYFMSHPEDVRNCVAMVNVIDVNRMTLQLLHAASKEELTGKLVHIFQEESYDGFREQLISLAEGKNGFESEMMIRTLRGNQINVCMKLSIAPNHQDTWSKVFVSLTDITEMKLIEKQLLRSQRIESIGMLAGGIAHDLNNLLSPILLSVEVLKMKFPDKKDQRIFETIESSATRGAELVKQILTFSKGVKGERQFLQIKHIIKDVSQIVAKTLLKSITIETNVPNNIKTVIGNPTQLHQVFLNLCVNARDAMPEGGSIQIVAENIHIDENYVTMNKKARLGFYVIISVTDSGTGMPSNVIEKIFDPFFTTKGEGKGTGLGLATCNDIIKKHGGFIDVKSKVGMGSTFKIYLPAQTKTLKDKTIVQETEIPKGHGELVLVVDDEASICEITKETLEAYEYQVLTACNGADGIGKFAKESDRISVVITDFQMPVMDGHSMIPALKAIKPDVKIISMGDVQSDKRITDATKKDIDSFLAKPFTAQKLLITLNDVLYGNVNCEA